VITAAQIYSTGTTGKCIDAHDDRYDTSYPTGYERNTLIIESEGEEFEVDSACVKNLEEGQQ